MRNHRDVARRHRRFRAAARPGLERLEPRALLSGVVTTVGQVVTITTNNTAGPHVIEIVPAPNQSGTFDVFIDDSTSGTPDGSFTPSSSGVNQVQVSATRTATNQMIIDLGTIASETYTDSGSYNGTLAAPIGSVNVTFSYKNIENVADTTTSGSFVFNDAQTAGTLALTDGGAVANVSTSTELQSESNVSNTILYFADKNNVTINAIGDSQVILNNPTAPSELESLTVNQPANCTVNVMSTAAGIPTTVVGGGSGDDVTVTDDGSVQEIKGALTITNPTAAGDTNVTLNASKDTEDVANPQATVTLDASAATNEATITNLAPAAINLTQNPANPFSQSPVPMLFVEGFAASTLYQVNNTLATTETDLYTVGSDSPSTVTILGTAGPFFVSGGAGGTITYVGTGNVQNIQGQVAISASTPNTPGGFNGLVVDDHADTTGRSPTITAGEISGLAPAAIFYSQANLTATGGTANPGLLLFGGKGGNDWTVDSTPAAPTTLNAGDGTIGDAVAVNETNATNPLTVNLGDGTNAVHVNLAQGNTYDLAVNGGGPAADNTLSVSDPTRAPVITTTPSPPATAGKVNVTYLLGYKLVGGVEEPTYETFSIPYTDIAVANLQLLPDAEHSLVQALYQDILEQDGSLAELNMQIALLQKTGKIQSVVTKLEDSPAGRKLAKHRAKIVLDQLPDFAEVEAELAASKSSRKHH